MSELGKALTEAILDFDEDDVLEAVKKMKAEGMTSLEIMEICKDVMDKIGKMFSNKEIFLTELIMSGELLSAIMDELGLTDSAMKPSGGESKGKILIGTVESDVHDIGKNIIKSLLISEGFEVIDIGVDVPVNKFVEEVKMHKPQIVAMSGLLTIAYESMKKTIDAFEKEGIRKDFKVIVGGGATDQQVADHVGADDFGVSAVDGVEKIRNWLK
jgi:5-methyltetrahydrofolate--homocysteine methyltransferase